MSKEWRNPYRLNFATLWSELEAIKKRISKLENKGDTYDVLFEIRNLTELDSLTKTIRDEMTKYGIVCVGGKT